MSLYLYRVANFQNENKKMNKYCTQKEAIVKLTAHSQISSQRYQIQFNQTVTTVTHHCYTESIIKLPHYYTNNA